VVKKVEGKRIEKKVVQSETVNGGGRGEKIISTSSPCFNAPANIHPSLLLRLFVLHLLPN
jgi:hypothetical protein